MSSETTVDSAPSGGTVNLGKYSAAAGLVGAAVVILILFLGLSASDSVDQKRFLGSYLYGLGFWTSLSLGMYVLTILNHMLRSKWTLSVLRILEAGSGWIPLSILGACFIPIAAKLPLIYEWAVPANVVGDKVLIHKEAYLNPTFWTIRLVFFFAVWIGTSAAFRRSVMRQEQTKDFQLENRRMSFGAASFVIFAVTGTFAFIDWLMSLEPHWSSTMYCLWFMVASSLAAYSLSVVIFNLNSDKAPFSGFVTKAVRHDQANMLFVHTMLWGYTSLSQYLIIWNGNLPENTAYYMRRSTYGWNAFGMATIIGQFFIPFFLLLAPRTWKNASNLRSVAGFMFAVHIIDYTLTVCPALPGRLGTFAGITIWDAVSFVGFGALWLLGFSLMFKQAPAFPTYDTRLQEAKANAH